MAELAQAIIAKAGVIATAAMLRIALIVDTLSVAAVLTAGTGGSTVSAMLVVRLVVKAYTIAAILAGGTGIVAGAAVLIVALEIHALIVIKAIGTQRLAGSADALTFLALTVGTTVSATAAVGIIALEVVAYSVTAVLPQIRVTCITATPTVVVVVLQVGALTHIKQIMSTEGLTNRAAARTRVTHLASFTGRTTPATVLGVGLEVGTPGRRATRLFVGASVVAHEAIITIGVHALDCTNNARARDVTGQALHLSAGTRGSAGRNT